MAVNNFGKRRDSNMETRPESAKVPMNKHPYNPATNANIKTHLSESSNVNTPVPPGGRKPDGYQNTGKGNFKTINNESGQSSSHMRVQGRVIKPTDHPNRKINGYYG